VANLEKAADRDPGSWTYRYDLALAKASAGLDPRADARKAVEMNPLNAEALNAVKLFSRGGPRAWRRQASTLLGAASPFYFSQR
jgi:hypothetical protein